MYTIDELIDNLTNSQKKDNVSLTGIKGIDCHLGSDSGLILIASRPAMGRMSIALTMIVNRLKEDPEYAAVIYSTEHSLHSVTARLLSIYSGINIEDISKNRVPEKNTERFEEAKSFFRGKNLKIADDIPVNKSDLLNDILKTKIKNDGRLDLIVIDSLDADLPVESLELYAKANTCYIIAFETLSESTERRDDHRPRLTDLPNYESIMKVFDTALLLYREEYYSELARDYVMTINVAKNSGIIGSTEVYLYRGTTGILDMTDEDYEDDDDTDGIEETEEGNPPPNLGFTNLKDEDIPW